VKVLLALTALLFAGSLPELAYAAGGGGRLDLTGTSVGYLSLFIFIAAYALVMAEEFTQLRKSKPVILAAGIIWGMIALEYSVHGMTHATEQAARRNLLEYAELMLFLLVAMTYINAMDERLVFDALRSWMVRRGFGLRQLFWLTGCLAFFISPLADNLTTALLMCAVVMAVGGDDHRFVTPACINIVVAVNAGGAFSPFGDITTLMVWQKGVLDFWTFFLLFIPALVNFVLPAAMMHFAIPNEQPVASGNLVQPRRGARRIVLLFLATIFTAVVFHSALHLPPVIGMLTGLSYLQFFGYYLKRTHGRDNLYAHGRAGDVPPFNVFSTVARAEWDTLLFFYGVVLCVGGLGFIGYLGLSSDIMYNQWGVTQANVSVGLLSAIVDNIPVMFAVLTMEPSMSQGQWLLVTLTAGVGGSLLSVGSAAGVALMGQSKGMYTFFGHLKWTPAIALGYAASIWVHMFINDSQF
jgi:NhaD family Na+/H+ antiporter